MKETTPFIDKSNTNNAKIDEPAVLSSNFDNMNAIADDSEPHEDSVPTTDSYDEFSLQHWQNKTAAVTDEFIRLKFQLETFQRDKERDASVIESLKHVRHTKFDRDISFQYL